MLFAINEHIPKTWSGCSMIMRFGLCPIGVWIGEGWGHKRGLMCQIQTLASVEISRVSNDVKRGTGLCDRLTDTIVKNPGLESGHSA